MIFHFPDLETLRIALTSALVPAAVAMEPAEVAFAADGGLSVKCQSIPPKKMQTALKRLGIQTVMAHSGEPIAVGSWPEILPLVKEARAPEADSTTPVLFEMPAARLADLATEMLRLGNDRQSLRSVSAPDNAEQLVLLRVIAPPYYTLLRAIDRLDPDVVAYVEAAPRVWVEYGWTHSLAAKLQAPEGRILLLRPPRSWKAVEDGPFQDIYEILDFQLPESAVDYAEGKLDKKLRVPLRLVPGNAADAAEMWVLKENALDVFDAFVRDADERVMGRLMFAVAENGQENPTIILRARPSKLTAPALELTGAAGFIRYRKIDNLFVPAGTRLQPTLRRDAVRRMLADDPAEIVWLTPLDGGRFVPETLADDAFRPLQDWVDYIIDREREALLNWVQATKFDFESFICTGNLPSENPEPPGAGKAKKRKAGEPNQAKADEDSSAAAPVTPMKKPPKTEEKAYAAPVVDATPSEHVLKRDELEKAFFAIDGPIEAPERAALWPQLAKVNAALCDYSEAALCWGHALWERDDLPASWLSMWFYSEVTGASAEIVAADLDRDLAIAVPTSSDLRQLAARLLYAFTRQPIPAALTARLPQIRQYLEKHDASLGIRAAWLVWRNLTKIAGDVLGLARVRDRLIERLFKQGLRAQYDVPSFIRFAGKRESNRVRRVREHLLQFRGEVQAWLVRQDQSNGASNRSLVSTGWYADLIFAYGLAKVGDERNSNDLMAAALAKLRDRNLPTEVSRTSQFLADAFEYRIQQAAKGGHLADSLPSALLSTLNPTDQSLLYKIKKLCKYLSILEPHEKSSPLLAWKQQQEIAGWWHIHDPAKLMAEIRGALGARRDPIPATARMPLRPHLRASEARVAQNFGNVSFSDWRRLDTLIHAIPISARVGEPFSRELLNQVVSSLTLTDGMSGADLLKIIGLHAKLVDVSVSLAANYGWADLVSDILKIYVSNLNAINDMKLSIVESVEEALGPWVYSLQRCGLRDQIMELLSDLTDLLLKGRTLDQLRQEYVNTSKSRYWVDMLRALLRLAECWNYVGSKNLAMPILEEVRGFLFDNLDKGGKNRPLATVYTPLTCAYVRALSQVDDLNFVTSRTSELLKRMDNIPNTTVTGVFFSAFHLAIVETLVLALVSDDFILGETARRWLDDDEYLIRRRIHADMKKLLAGSGL